MNLECGRLPVQLAHLEGGFLFARPTGTLTPSTHAPLREALLRCSADLPAALIVDVSQLHVTARNSWRVFGSVLSHIEKWPGIPLALVAEDPVDQQHIQAARLDRCVPIYPDVVSAVSAIETPERRQTKLHLPWDATSSARAREFARTSCHTWALPPELVDHTVTVATELVENTLLHTHSAAELMLELRQETLAIAVFDDDPAQAVLREHPHGRLGLGLRIIAKLAKTWGCTPTMDGGKAVWGVLRVKK